MRIKLTVFGHELFEWTIGKEEDFSALLPLLLEDDSAAIRRFGGNDYASSEINEEQVDLSPYYDPDEEWEEDVPEMFGFHK